MTEWIWINGRVIPLSQAVVGVEDRGFQFADGVYEVIRFYGGKPFALAEHLERLRRSAEGILLSVPVAAEELAKHIRALIPKSELKEGMIYLQLTRGVCPRSHPIPAAGQAKPTLLFYARELPALPAAKDSPGVKVHGLEDLRWRCCWIKSIALLPNILAKSKAVAAGADEAVFIDHGVVTEGATSNLFLVKGTQLITHPIGEKVLPGITRQMLLELAPSVGLEPVQRPAKLGEAMGADELFISSTTRHINWVSHWGGKPVRPGKLGKAGLMLAEARSEELRKGSAGEAAE